MVVDTSVILAVYFNESNGPWAIAQLEAHAASLRMSTVNLAEALIRIRDLRADRADVMEERLLTSGIRFVPPDAAQARIVTRARLAFPLNLGDCFAYALAVAEDCPILTLDTGFRATDRPLVMP